LLVNGADVNAAMKNGKTPSDVAKTDEIKIILSQFGG
jgi:hypothetical protein